MLEASKWLFVKSKQTADPRYYERRYRQLGHKMVARRLCQKWPHSRGHYYAHLWAFLHPRSQLLKVDSPKIEVNMNEHQDTPICGDKSNFVGSKVTPLAGSPQWWFLLTFASEASTPRLLPFWQQVKRSAGNHFMPQLAVPSFIVPGLRDFVCLVWRSRNLKKSSLCQPCV